MHAVSGEAQLGLAARLWIYKRERLPLVRTLGLLLVFSAASINVSAFLAGVARPGLAAYAVAWIVCFIIFAQLRASDEVKDREDDAAFRPERPIPRGLVSLRLIVAIAVGLTPVALVLAAGYHGALAVPLLGVWLWLGLMSVEFGAPDWLKARPLVYLVSHMLIMPLIDLFVTACEWLPRAGSPPAGLWLFLLLSFVNGCILEIGRKIMAPEQERMGVETYSKLWGLERAVSVLAACLATSALLLICVGAMTGTLVATAVVAAAALVGALRIVRDFRRRPSAASQARIDLVAGLWVAACYATAGFLPLALGGGA